PAREAPPPAVPAQVVRPRMARATAPAPPPAPTPPPPVRRPETAPAPASRPRAAPRTGRGTAPRTPVARPGRAATARPRPRPRPRATALRRRPRLRDRAPTGPPAPPREARPRPTAPPLTALGAEPESKSVLWPAHHGEPVLVLHRHIGGLPLLLRPDPRIRRRAPAPGEGEAVHEHAVGDPGVGAVEPLHVMVGDRLRHERDVGGEDRIIRHRLEGGVGRGEP